MTYKDQLHPWCIIRPVSSVQMRIVGRFRRRSDAEGHLQILKRMIPDVSFEIMSDIAPEETEPEDLTFMPENEEQESSFPLGLKEELGEMPTEEEE